MILSFTSLQVKDTQTIAWKRLPKRLKKQCRGFEKKKVATTPAKAALGNANKTASGTVAAARMEDEAINVSSKDGAEVAEDALTSVLHADFDGENLDEPADELEDQLMQMFGPYDEAAAAAVIRGDSE